jgi:hypothetical protein
MQLLILILKKIDLTNVIMKKLAESGVKGGTTVDGNGMADAIADMEDLPIFGLLRNILVDGEKEVCKVMLFVVRDEQLNTTREIIKNIIGDFSAPNTGIMFSSPINNVEGLGE